MATVEAAQERVDELRALLVSLRSARAGVPSLRRPTTAVGTRGTWTGSAAHRLQADEMSPLAGQLTWGLERAEQAVLDELAQAQQALDRAEDEEASQERTARTPQ